MTTITVTVTLPAQPERTPADDARVRELARVARYFGGTVKVQEGEKE